jgi:hypothetical protein
LRYTTTYVEWLSSPPASEATNAELGCWLRVAAWCAHHETGSNLPGTEVSRRKPLSIAMVPGLRRWKPQAWFALYTSRKDVEAMVAAGLGRWQGDDLVICGYDSHSQRSYGRMRHDPEVPAQTPPQDPAQTPPQGRADQSHVDQGSKKISLRSDQQTPPDPESDYADDELVEYEATPDPEHHCSAPPGCCTHNMRPVARS